MEKALFVTTNENKLREARAILGGEIEGVELDLTELQSLDVAEVAAEKARAARGALHEPPHPVIVEDSGIVFSAWNGLPGALTKWFLRSVGNDGLLRMLAAEQDRSARAVCAVAVATADGGVGTYLGEVDGEIADRPRGEEGFGWDPIFVPYWSSNTFAELGPRKHEDSHRARAFRAARVVLAANPGG